MVSALERLLAVCGANESAIAQLDPGVKELSSLHVDGVTAPQVKLPANVASTELSKTAEFSADRKELSQPTSVAQTDMLIANFPDFETTIYPPLGF